MSDTPQGPGWWQASDDKWYPPPRPEMPGDYEAVPQSPPTHGSQEPPTAMPADVSPYGGMPAPQQVTSPNRMPLYVAAAAFGVVLVVGLVFFLLQDDDGGGGDDEPDGPDPAEAVALGDDLMLLEQGFSTARDSWDDSLRPSYGFVIENTGNQARQNLRFSVTVKDAEGLVMDHVALEVSVIQPGEVVGVGLTHDGIVAGSEVPNEVGEIDIDYGGSSAGSGESGSLTTGNVNVTADDTVVRITMSVESEYTQQIDNPTSYVIFRDGDGQIVGGLSAPEPGFIPAGGQIGASFQEMIVLADEVDLEQSEGYVVPGP